MHDIDTNTLLQPRVKLDLPPGGFPLYLTEVKALETPAACCGTSSSF